MNSIAIMQPYFFPYLGYFQLIEAVDEFIFYDDVNYITGGWINRNKILISNDAKYFTVPCKNASQNDLIRDVKHAMDNRTRGKLIKKIKFPYGNAPYFERVFPIVKKVLESDTDFIADIAMQSIKETSDYLDLDVSFEKSSKKYDNASLDAADRLIDICKKENIDNYINAVGGKKLYSKSYFKEKGVNLSFLEPQEVKYDQGSENFVPWLSIIDVMMFNSPEKIKDDLLKSYQLI